MEIAMRTARRIAAASFLMLAASCGSDEIVSLTGAPNNTLSADVGNEVSITLQTIGQGQYLAPSVSSANVEYVGVSQLAVISPAGPTQKFTFRAVSRGMAVLMFTHTGNNPTVQDTIVVR
jgi:hypothetical protein